MNVAWWCAAGGGPWTWEPQAYPGVWLFQAALLAAWAIPILRRRARGEPGATRSEAVSFLVGWAFLWATLDWPLGALGAGYLLLGHMLQFVMILWVLGPLLEAGLPTWMRRALFAARPAAPLRWIVVRPFRAFVLFNVVVVVTHVPIVADTLKPLQLGSMAIDIAWIVSGLLFWLSISPRETTPQAPGRLEVVYGRRLLYVVGIKILPILIGAFYVFADYPLYRTFELAPRVFADFSAFEDQVLAGWLMWAGTTPFLVWRFGAAFFAWHELETRRAGEV